MSGWLVILSAVKLIMLKKYDRNSIYMSIIYYNKYI